MAAWEMSYTDQISKLRIYVKDNESQVSNYRVNIYKYGKVKEARKNSKVLIRVGVLLETYSFIMYIHKKNSYRPMCAYIHMCTYTHTIHIFPRPVHLRGSTCNDSLLEMNTLYALILVSGYHPQLKKQSFLEK